MNVYLYVDKSVCICRESSFFQDLSLYALPLFPLLSLFFLNIFFALCLSCFISIALHAFCFPQIFHSLCLSFPVAVSLSATSPSSTPSPLFSVNSLSSFSLFHSLSLSLSRALYHTHARTNSFSVNILLLTLCLAFTRFFPRFFSLYNLSHCSAFRGATPC